MIPIYPHSEQNGNMKTDKGNYIFCSSFSECNNFHNHIFKELSLGSL